MPAQFRRFPKKEDVGKGMKRVPVLGRKYAALHLQPVQQREGGVYLLSGLGSGEGGFPLILRLHLCIKYQGNKLLMLFRLLQAKIMNAL